MRIQVHPFVALLAGSLLLTAAALFLVCLPVILISWVWNACIAGYTSLPQIALWQSGLLYLAIVCIIYLLDIVHIEIKAETLD